MTIRLKRVYAPPAEEDGCRVLVDRIWPRGLSREDARLDEWLKELAPSSALRRWFGHDPAKWPEFKCRYFQELQDKDSWLAVLAETACTRTLTLVFGARDETHNNAVALKEFLERKWHH
jgi:uncharacterized protein YeaO (DUF488 family)